MPVGRQLGGADALQDGVADQVGDDDVARRRADDVAVRAVGAEHDAARVAARVVAFGGSMVKMRVTGLTANGPGAVGALMVGLPVPSKSMRTMKSLPWLTTQQASVPSEQSMSTGADGNMRSVLSRICASSRPGRQVEVDAAVQVEGLVGELVVRC